MSKAGLEFINCAPKSTTAEEYNCKTQDYKNKFNPILLRVHQVAKMKKMQVKDSDEEVGDLDWFDFAFRADL